MVALGAIGLLLAALGVLAMAGSLVGMAMENDRLADLMGWGIGGVLLGILLVLPAAISSDMDARKAFMAECQKDRKEYECTAMWRAGEAKAVAVPMPIIVQGR